MPRPAWGDEDKNMHPTCEANASGNLTGQDTAFINQIKNKNTLTWAESIELYRLWHKVLGRPMPMGGIEGFPTLSEITASGTVS